MPASTAPEGVRFLEDVRVLEVANLAPTQLGMHLADLGAEVIKVEPPVRGDATRLIGMRPGFDASGVHRRWNRGKRSVAIDMTKPEGVEVFLSLVPHVDVVIEGLRPGTLARMGAPWERLIELNPKLVMVAICGWGQDGPYRDIASHGIGFDAVAGLVELGRDEAGRPRVSADHVHVGTFLSPLFGATSTLAALSWSRRTGKPVFLDVALADAAVFANMKVEDQAAMRNVEAAGTMPTMDDGGPSAFAAGGQTIQAYRTKDDHVLLLMALERKFFVRLVNTIGRPDLLDQVPEKTYLVRINDEIDDVIAEQIATRDLAEWMTTFAEADVPAVPLHETNGVLDDPHMQERLEWIPGGQDTLTLKTPVHSSPPVAAPAPAQAIGENTLEVLTSIGMDRAEIDRLAGEGVLLLGDALRR